MLGKSGAVTDSTDASLVTWAKKNNKQVWAMVGNRSDQEATHQMLSSATARNTAVNQLAAVVSKYGLDGLNIDFENVAA
jgi:spore germination protein